MEDVPVAFVLKSLLFSGMIIAAAVNLARCVARVPSGHFRVVSRFGKYLKVLRPGIHFVTPIDSYVECVWTEIVEDVAGKQIVQTRRVIDYPTVNQKIDPPPLTIRLRDRQEVTVNGALWWCVNLKKDGDDFAFFEHTSDPINLIHEAYKQAIIGAVGSYTAAELIGCDVIKLADNIRAQLVATVNMPSISLAQVTIQSISYPKKTEEALAEAARNYQNMQTSLQHAKLRKDVDEAEAANKMAIARQEEEKRRYALVEAKRTEQACLIAQHEAELSATEVRGKISARNAEIMIATAQRESERRKIEAEAECAAMKMRGEANAHELEKKLEAMKAAGGNVTEMYSSMIFGQIYGGEAGKNMNTSVLMMPPSVARCPGGGAADTSAMTAMLAGAFVAQKK